MKKILALKDGYNMVGLSQVMIEVCGNCARGLRMLDL